MWEADNRRLSYKGLKAFLFSWCEKDFLNVGCPHGHSHIMESEVTLDLSLEIIASVDQIRGELPI